VVITLVLGEWITRSFEAFERRDDGIGLALVDGIDPLDL
jgi:hypothetical protein